MQYGGDNDLRPQGWEKICEKPNSFLRFQFEYASVGKQVKQYYEIPC